MLIDFHVHMFPEALAKKTLPKLAISPGATGRTRPTSPTAQLPGHLAAQAGRVGAWTAPWTLHIATSVHAMHKVNDFAAAVKSERLYSFGSVHPDAPDALEELDRIQALGLDGVKFHPDYQDFFVDDEKMAPIYEKIQSLGLPVTFHAGWDPLSPEVVHAEPERLARVLDAFPRMTVIGAHLGGLCRYDQVEKFLLGRRNLYLDTAMTAPYLEDEAQYGRILRGHGLDRVLFATDCPWSTPLRELPLLERAGFTPEERERITWKNALALLERKR